MVDRDSSAARCSEAVTVARSARICELALVSCVRVSSRVVVRFVMDDSATSRRLLRSAIMVVAVVACASKRVQSASSVVRRCDVGALPCAS